MEYRFDLITILVFLFLATIIHNLKGGLDLIDPILYLLGLGPCYNHQKADNNSINVRQKVGTLAANMVMR
jgi:hypothetical protein